jgi:cytochrome P450
VQVAETRSKNAAAPVPAGAPQTLNAIVERLYAMARAGASGTRAFGQMLLIDEAEACDEIFRRPDVFLKDYSAVSRLGFSRFNTDGDEWARRRDLTQPLYREAARTANRPAIRAIYDAAFDAADAGDPTAIERAALGAAAAVFHGALGCTAPAEGTLGLFDRLRPILKRLQHVALFGASEEERAALRADSRKAVQGVERWCEENASLRAALAALAARAGGIPRFQAHEESLMNLFAGVDTSAATMAWAIDRLGALGTFQEELRAEARAGADAPLLDVFLSETLRYFPPIPFLVRRAAAPTTLAGIAVEARHVIVISIVGLHQNARYWSEPQAFQPRRAEFSDGAYNRRAFLPFSMGPRVCGGAGLARLEIAEGLKSLLSRFRIARKAGPPAFDYALAMRPQNWSALVFEPLAR